MTARGWRVPLFGFTGGLGDKNLTCFRTIAILLLCRDCCCCCEKSALISLPEVFLKYPLKSYGTFSLSERARVFQSHPFFRGYLLNFRVFFLWPFGIMVRQSTIHLWGSVHAVDGWFRNPETITWNVIKFPCKLSDFNYRSLNWWTQYFRTINSSLRACSRPKATIKVCRDFCKLTSWELENIPHFS